MPRPPVAESAVGSPESRVASRDPGPGTRDSGFSTLSYQPPCGGHEVLDDAVAHVARLLGVELDGPDVPAHGRRRELVAVVGRRDAGVGTFRRGEAVDEVEV